MSDLVTCPTCQSTLRLPATATTVRCPKCKTMLQVIETGAESPPPPPPVAPPLPFAAKPKPKPTAGRPAKPQSAKKTVHRPMLVDEAAEAEFVAEEEARKSAERRREVRQQLDELEEDEEVAAEEYEDIQEECLWGRRAMACMQWGMGGYAAGILLVFFAILATVIFTLLGTSFASVAAPFVILGLVVGFLGTLAQAVGFGLAFRGPPRPRHIAIFGLVATAAQILVVCVGLGQAMKDAQQLEKGGGDEGFASDQMGSAYSLLGLVTNFFLLADAPTRLAMSLTMPGFYHFPVLMLVAGVFEFARLVFVCQLTQSYGELGKNDRIAAESGKAIGKVFWVLLLTCLFRFAIAVCFDRAPLKEGMWMTGQALHGLLFIVAFGLLGFRLLMQVQVIRDTHEVLTAERVASKQERLDVV